MLELKKFRFFMYEKNVDAFLLHTKNRFLNEYSEELEKICGFTGTNGLLIVLKSNKCPFFTDDRYILQAANQLDQSIFQILNVRKESPYRWIKANLMIASRVGYYSESFTVKEIRKYDGICRLVPFLTKKGILYKQKIVSHTLELSGESSKNKCKRVIKSIDKEDVMAVLLTDPNSVSWLLNLRNENAKYTPCVLGHALLHKNGSVDLFIQNKKSSSLEVSLDDHISFFDVSDLENSLHKISSIMIDPFSAPMSIMSMMQNKRVVEREDPCLLSKAVKNQTEIRGAINAHARDGVAVTNFLYWLEGNCNSNKVTELDAESKLLEYRKKQTWFKQLSFPTISAFNENGAIVHYTANSKTNKIIQEDGLYLIDSGGQYLDGTTDVTRTIAIGNPTEEQIMHYTVVLKAHIAIASAVFPFETTGEELNILARIHLWNFGIDYMHCTGHGVGSYLSVHEGPQAISKGNRVKLIPGMVLSNEPGYYIPEKYGIRIENLMYIGIQENGFLSFEQLTLIPYDKKLINVGMLTKQEIIWINSYHKLVYRNLIKSSIENKLWLKKICSPL